MAFVRRTQPIKPYHPFPLITSALADRRDPSPCGKILTSFRTIIRGLQEIIRLSSGASSPLASSTCRPISPTMVCLVSVAAQKLDSTSLILLGAADTFQQGVQFPL